MSQRMQSIDCEAFQSVMDDTTKAANNISGASSENTDKVNNVLKSSQNIPLLPVF